MCSKILVMSVPCLFKLLHYCACWLTASLSVVWSRPSVIDPWSRPSAHRIDILPRNDIPAPLRPLYVPQADGSSKPNLRTYTPSAMVVIGEQARSGSGSASWFDWGKLSWTLSLVLLLVMHWQFSHLQDSVENFVLSNKYLDGSSAAVTSTAGQEGNWCGKVNQSRSDLLPELRITVPCEKMKPAKSAVVCFLTAGVPDGQGDHKVFTGTDYINGALALGASLQDHVTRKDVHQLLLVRDGFTIPEDKIAMLEAVGWTMGKAPKVDVDQRYIPRYERYKTLYTKISVIGLSEYDCVLLLDADALTVGNLDDLMSCRKLQPNYRVAGTLDLYHGQWYHFNTGSALWNTSSQEMNRVYQMTKDPSFMRRFESDQIFTNTVYPDRTNRTLNAMILDGSVGPERWGQVADLGWEYNAQTHVEYQWAEWWEERLPSVKILHFTHAKGWQCPERHGGPPEPKQDFPRNSERCNKVPGCACNEGYRWYDYLDEARSRASKKIAIKQQ